MGSAIPPQVGDRWMGGLDLNDLGMESGGPSPVGVRVTTRQGVGFC